MTRSGSARRDPRGRSGGRSSIGAGARAGSGTARTAGSSCKWTAATISGTFATIVDCDRYRDILLEEEAENLLPGMAPGGGAGGGRRRGRAGAPSGAAAGHREREFTGDSESDEDAERMVRIARL